MNRSLFAFDIETYQWMLKLTTHPEHSLRTLQLYLGFNLIQHANDLNLVTQSLFTFPVVHSAPLKYNWSYHRNHINLFFMHIFNLVVEQTQFKNLSHEWEKLTLHRMHVIICQTLCFFDWISSYNWSSNPPTKSSA